MKLVKVIDWDDSSFYINPQNIDYICPTLSPHHNAGPHTAIFFKQDNKVSVKGTMEEVMDKLGIEYDE